MADAVVESPWKRSSVRRVERELKREAVLRMAVRLFNQKGFHATSLDEVAERLHVTKPTLYYYVKNKDEILFESVRIGLEAVRLGIAEATASGGSALERLRMCMNAYLRVVTDDFGRCVIRVGEDPLPPASRRKLRKLKAEIDHEFRQLIEEGVAEGSLAPIDPKLAAFMIAGAISWIGRWYREDGELTPEQIAEQSIGLLLNGVLNRPAAGRKKAA